MTTSIPSDAPVLVTGGCGFVGRHLVRALSEQGERVRVLDLADPAPLAADVQHVRGSILSEADVRAAMADVRRVYHLAAIAHLWRRDKADFARVNTQGTQAVLACAATMPVERVIYCSTESILLPKPHRRSGPIDGTAPPPLEDMPGPYTRSKHLAERVALGEVL
jgi:dihydroflavonol-4-reductase